MRGIVEVRSDNGFKIIDEKYDSGEYILTKNKTLNHLLPHAGAVIQKSIIMLSILGFYEEATSTEENSSEN